MRLTNPNGQIIAQHDGDYEAKRYFYLRERLGSVRQVIDMYGSVERNYTYSPFGQLLESGAASGAPSNPFMFTGQWFDDEISQYFLRARMYDPVLMRFTARDPVRGKFKDPLTLHVYLYCLNEPINRADPSGEPEWDNRPDPAAPGRWRRALLHRGPRGQSPLRDLLQRGNRGVPRPGPFQ